MNSVDYNHLENKIEQVKLRLFRLWNYYDNDETISNKDDEDDDFQSIKNGSLTSESYNSCSNYNNEKNYDDELSQCSFKTALENFDVNVEELEEIPEIHTPEQIPLCNQEIPKKSVSFDNNITIHETECYYSRRSKTAQVAKEIKSRVLDYFTYEKFIFRYKWYKIKRNINNRLLHRNNISMNNNNNNSSTISNTSSLNSNNNNSNNSNKNFIDLYIFFSKYFETFFIETDVDNNCRYLYYFQFPLQKTDLNYELRTNPISQNDSKSSSTTTSPIPPSDIINPQLIKYKSSSLDKKKIEFYYECDESSFLRINHDNKSIKPNILLDYLVARAQSPIELKIANSVVKLSLPLWYQSSLIL